MWWSMYFKSTLNTNTEIVYVDRNRLLLDSIVELALIIRYADRYEDSRNDTDW